LCVGPFVRKRSLVHLQSEVGLNLTETFVRLVLVPTQG